MFVGEYLFRDIFIIGNKIWETNPVWKLWHHGGISVAGVGNNQFFSHNTIPKNDTLDEPRSAPNVKKSKQN